MSYGKSVTVPRDFDEVVADVRAALADQGFGVITEINMQATMKNKLDEDIEPYIILGACNPPLAHRALQTEVSIGLLLPCNVVIRREEDTTVVEALNPNIMVEATGQPALSSVAEDASARLDNMLAALN